MAAEKFDPVPVYNRNESLYGDAAPVAGGAATPVAAEPLRVPVYNREEPLVETAQPVKPEAKPDYANMGWWDVAGRGAKALPGDMRDVAMALPHAVANPGETWGGVKSLARGAAGATGLYGGATPEDKAAFSGAVAPYTAAWDAVSSGDTAGLKEQIAEHPANLALSYAPVAGAAGAGLRGLSAGAKTAGAANAVTKGLEIAGNAVGKTGQALNMLDPVQAGMAGVTKLGGPVVKGTMAGLSDKPYNAYTKGFEAAKEGGKALEDFKSFATGDAGPVDFSTRVRKAMAAKRDEEINAWAQSKQGVAAQGRGPVNLDDALDTIRANARKMGNPALAIDPAAHQAMFNAYQAVLKHAALPPGAPGAQLLGVDKLKQRLHAAAEAAPNDEARTAVHGVRDAVRDALIAHAPEYEPLMSGWQTMQDNFNNIEKSLGTGSKTAASSEMAKFLKAQKTPGGRDLIDQLAQYDRTLPHAVAGASFAGPGKLGRAPNIAELGMLAHSLYSGNPVTGLLGGAGALFGNVPALQRTAPILAGRAARLGKPLEQVYHAGQQTVLPEERGHNAVRELTVHPRRASGGAVKGHQHLVDRLFAAHERAKREEKAHTAGILHQPDEAVAKALHVAQAAI
jgi:hypothetical protein